MASQDFLLEYIEEVKEHLQELEECLLILEREGSSKRELSRIFRAAHSIKGASAYMGFEQLASLTHELESFMSTVQNNPQPLPPKAVSTLLACVDFISYAVSHLHDHGMEPPISRDLLESLSKLHSGVSADTHTQQEPARPGPEEKGEISEGPAVELFIEEAGAQTPFQDERPEESQFTTETPPGLSTQEEIIEEEDEELFGIFLSSFQEQFTKLHDWAKSLRGRRASDDDLQVLLGLVGRLVSSSQYMDYERVVGHLEKLEEAILKAQAEPLEDGTALVELIENTGRAIEHLLPGLKLSDVGMAAPSQSGQECMLEALHEEDEELLGIFTESVSQQLADFAALISGPKGIPIEASQFGKAREILQKLVSSSRYMGYEPMVEMLGEWDNTLVENHEKGFLDPSHCIELFEHHTKSLRQLLPGLNIQVPQTRPEDPEPLDATCGQIDISFEDLESVALPLVTQKDEPSRHESAGTSDVLKGQPGSFSAESVDPEPSIARKSRPAVSSEEPGGGATLRVDAQKVDQLLNQVGELVVTRSEFIQTSLSFREILRELTVQGKLSKQEVRKLRALGFKLNESTLSLGRVANDLQNSIMRVRMLPISYLFQRFPRVVRDQALKLGKNVELVVEGADTEIDKRVLEQMHDPLVQLLRNAIAHAMEEPSQRRKANKPEMGTIRLAAYHEGDYVAIEIEDDGRGIDTEKLKGILQSQGRIAPEQLERLSEKELLYAIFLPGISTKERVDGTAGRGVGLDVVKENLERMNGSIEVESQSTQGTRFTIRIPLTVAIIRALMVKGSEQVFAVPLSSVSKILRYESDEVHTIEGFRVITHRGKTLPLVHLGQLLNIPSQASDDGHRFIVVVTTSFREVGLVVDGLIGEREIVIKSIEDGAHDYEGFSGATILGDGTVSLILDVSALLRLMKNWPGVDPAVLDPMGFGEEPLASQRAWS